MVGMEEMSSGPSPFSASSAKPTGPTHAPFNIAANFLILIGILAVLTGGIIWYVKASWGPAQTSLTQPTGPLSAEQAGGRAEAGLGANIYQGSANPIQGKLPVSSNPAEAANPITGLYQNPFE